MQNICGHTNLIVKTCAGICNSQQVD